MISLFSKRGSYQSMFDISSGGYVELELSKTFFKHGVSIHVKKELKIITKKRNANYTNS